MLYRKESLIMLIEKYDMYEKKRDGYSSYEMFPEYDSFFYISRFFLVDFKRFRSFGMKVFFEELNMLGNDTIGTEDVNINIDQNDNKIYISESYYTYDQKPRTPEIEKLFNQSNFLELCKIGFLDYVTMTKDNFFHLLLIWDRFLDQSPPFVLLYEDDKNWFDILPFDSKKAMEKFVADHTELEETQK